MLLILQRFSLVLLHTWRYIRRHLGVAPSAAEDSHPLLNQYSQFSSYNTSHARYPAIRTLYVPHAHSEKLQAISDLPLLVFIHGLGGSLPQFVPLLKSFSAIAPCFGIELPGHGSSEFSPSAFEAYTFDAFVELWQVAINEVCLRYHHLRVVFVCHSLGCSIGASLASSESLLDVKVSALIAICPKAIPPTQSQTNKFQRLLQLPDFILNTLRFFDRLGGPNSKSVNRFVGTTTDAKLRHLQLRYNRQFRTPVWKRSSLGLLPRYDYDGIAHGGLPGLETWQKVQIPLFLIAGESDTVTKASEARMIKKLLRQGSIDITFHRPSSQHNEDIRNHSVASERTEEEILNHPAANVVQLDILPAPASHALIYDHITYRTVAGLVEDFLSQHVSHQLELGWQLQQLTNTGKWDVKNLAKWKKVAPVSGPIDGGRFRALKTLREQDEEHTPSVFLQRYSTQFYAIIDISHDNPVYDTKAIEKGGVQYHKFATVSKIPPTPTEVHDFIVLVDRLRDEMQQISKPEDRHRAIGVHCHYGYNRTGFFIVCYLVERRGYSIPDAIEEFARQKPPGIRHAHFIDTLYVRYAVGLRRGSI